MLDVVLLEHRGFVFELGERGGGGGQVGGPAPVYFWFVCVFLILIPHWKYLILLLFYFIVKIILHFRNSY